MSTKKDVAVSACLLGYSCRYDGNHNLNQELFSTLKEYHIIPFCPEDYAFGTPRPTMDLITNHSMVRAISNKNGSDLSIPIFRYAHKFFQENPNIELFIGKDRSPSCGVKSAKVYDKDKNIISKNGTGLMAKVALDLGIDSWDLEDYISDNSDILPKK